MSCWKTHDRLGNRVTRDVALRPQFSEIYTYDKFSQLKTETRGDGTSEQWDLEHLGNWAAWTVNGSVQTRDHNVANELTGISGAWVDPVHDSAGNMASAAEAGNEDARLHYTWDAWNRMTEMRKDRKGKPGALLARYVYDGETIYYTHDPHFNVTALVDANGKVVERYAYSPYGEVTYLRGNWNPGKKSAYDNNVLFSGYRLDSETGNYQVRYRYYHPTMGRWLSRDPVGEWGGVNLFVFARNSSVNLIDSHGLQYPITGVAQQPATWVTLPALGTILAPVAPYVVVGIVLVAGPCVAYEIGESAWGVSALNTTIALEAAQASTVAEEQSKKESEKAKKDTPPDGCCASEAAAALPPTMRLLSDWVKEGLAKELQAFPSHIAAAEHQAKYGLYEHQKALKEKNPKVKIGGKGYNHLAEVSGYCADLMNRHAELKACLAKKPGSPKGQKALLVLTESLNVRCELLKKAPFLP
jgi:RHS repeat-associated protein